MYCRMCFPWGNPAVEYCEAEMVSSAENRELSKFSSFRAGIGQNIPVCASPTASSRGFPVSTCQFIHLYSVVLDRNYNHAITETQQQRQNVQEDSKANVRFLVRRKKRQLSPLNIVKEEQYLAFCFKQSMYSFNKPYNVWSGSDEHFRDTETLNATFWWSCDLAMLSRFQVISGQKLYEQVKLP